MSRHERWRQVTLFLKKVLDGGDCRINVDIVYFQCLPALGWFCKTVITVDGGEGGTGAAPVELTNSVGMPLRDGLHFVHNALRGIGVRDKIRIIASGKVFSAFHILRINWKTWSPKILIGGSIKALL